MRAGLAIDLPEGGATAGDRCIAFILENGTVHAATLRHSFSELGIAAARRSVLLACLSERLEFIA